MQDAIWLSLKLAIVTTPLVVILATIFAWYGSNPMARANLGKIGLLTRQILISLVTLPIILPPTVLGFYLLVFMGSNGPLVWLGSHLGVTSNDWRGLAFSFSGLVVGSVVFCLPFAVQTLQNSFAQLGARLFEVAACLGASPRRQFFAIALPLCRKSIIVATILSFAHIIGEFGVVLMLGGNIPGQTRVISIALYEAVEEGQWSEANQLAGCLLLFALAVMLLVAWLGRGSRSPSPGR